MTSAEQRPGVKVWDPVVRILHWTLAACIAAAWFTRHGGGIWHEWIGYASLVIVALRLAWGWAGPRHAQFSAFVGPPSATLVYARLMASGEAPRHIGHNPLGGWMILALLLVTALAASSGWLYTTDTYWGVEWVEDAHEALAIFLLVLVAMHVTGVAAASWLHHENLVAAMFHGRKRPPQDGDVT